MNSHNIFYSYFGLDLIIKAKFLYSHNSQCLLLTWGRMMVFQGGTQVGDGDAGIKVFMCSVSPISAAFQINKYQN